MAGLSLVKSTKEYLCDVQNIRISLESARGIPMRLNA
jgi:hypothetical protein